MPHVILKMFPGRTEEQKKRLCDRIVEDVSEIAGCHSNSVSVSIEEIDQGNWYDLVFKPDILDRPETVYKSPGEEPPETERGGQL